MGLIMQISKIRRKMLKAWARGKRKKAQKHNWNIILKTLKNKK
jgi:predicted phage tail protein